MSLITLLAKSRNLNLPVVAKSARALLAVLKPVVSMSSVAEATSAASAWMFCHARRAPLR